ncbi:MAG: aminotransferase class III-fold pyridoxal phosphate-dependent enzyme [Planctomycetaceae bacterium]|nr:aminotransferase class III-fold pyridoxal phosphate-dependent enzyme [Planctomycetaceae bacterium]
MNYHPRVRRSMQLYDRALKIIPGATQLISRRPQRFAFGVSPVYIEHAQGARFTDVDGNQYIDWASGILTIILGYCDPIVDAAVKKQIDLGSVYSLNHEIELELAELLIDRIPCAEMVRFAKGGGDACAVAVRIARGNTNKDKILFCGYHGWHDWYQAANLTTAGTPPLDEHLFAGIEPIGIPQALANTAISFPYGDLDRLEQTLIANRGEVAAIIMEPFRTCMPAEGYLAEVKKLAHAHDALLIFDEVSTGFRPADTGVQTVLGVKPDMAVFAKSISNGYAMGAIVGSRESMAGAAEMFISSTYWSDTIGIRAAITTLEEIRKRNTVDHIHHVGKTMASKFKDLATHYDLPITIGGLDYNPMIQFDLDQSTCRKLNTIYIQEMAKLGIHTGLGLAINGSHGEEEISETIAAAEQVFARLANGLADDALDQLIECELKTDSFRRLVK